MEVKICPMCQKENAADAVLCEHCFAAIRSVQPISKEPAKVASAPAGQQKVIDVSKMGFACNNFVFSRQDVEDITNEIFTTSTYLNEYRTLVDKITLEYDESNMDINAYAGWSDAVNEIGPYIKMCEGMIAKTIPIAAMYLRGVRGTDLIYWIKAFSKDPDIFDGQIPAEARELGKAMLAEVIAHETAHIVKKHLPTLVRYSHSSKEQLYELVRNFERDADMTAIMILETTPYRAFYFLGALLISLVIYINEYSMFDYDGSHSHPADKERLLNLLVHSTKMLLQAGINSDELNAYCNLAGVSLIG